MFSCLSPFALKTFLMCKKLNREPFKGLLVKFGNVKLNCNGSLHAKKYENLFDPQTSKEERQSLSVLSGWIFMPSAG